MNFLISGRFHGCSTRFLAPMMISTDYDPRYTVIWKSTKLVNFVIFGLFMGYSTRFLAPGTFSTALDPRYTVIRKSTKHVNFVIFLPFSWAIAHGFWLRGRFQRPLTPGRGNLEVDKTLGFYPFWPFSRAIACCFGSGDHFNGP